jgi:hypothetical protein
VTASIMCYHIDDDESQGFHQRLVVVVAFLPSEGKKKRLASM